jgi:long-chain acyl-CoA synthetase
MNVFVEVSKRLALHANQTALINFRSHQSMTAGELLNAAGELARSLSIHLPKKKAVVALSLTNGEDAVIAVLALWQLGHAVMPLPPSFPVKETESILMAGPATILIYSSLKDFGPSVRLGRFSLRHFRAESTCAFPMDELAFVRFTSGTTERARAVLISHKAILERVRSFSQVLGLRSGMSVLWPLDMSYHFTTSIVSFLLQGCTIHIGSTLLPAKFVDWVNRHRIDLFFSLPFFYDQLASIESKISIEETQLFVTGQSIDPRILHAFEERHGRPIRRMYGVIEAGIPALLSESDDPNVIGPVAKPYEIRIGAQGRGGRGRIEVKSPGFFSGYLTGAQFDYEAFDGDWFDTGDLGFMNSDGELVIEGRAKELIVLPGHKFFPSEIETAMNSLPGVLASAAFVAGDPQVLFIAYTSNMEIGMIEIENHLRRRLEHAKIPQKFLWVSELKKTSSGKILRDHTAYKARL